jgi:anti-sigma B factor antagonist
MNDGAGRLRIFVDGRPDRVVIRLDGVLDAPGRLRFREQIRELLGRGGSDVVVDVGALHAVDVPGLAALLRADLLLRGVRSTMYIHAASPVFVDLLRATGLDGRLNVDPADPARRSLA